jgi:hypothetical protein
VIWDCKSRQKKIKYKLIPKKILKIFFKLALSKI